VRGVWCYNIVEGAANKKKHENIFSISALRQLHEVWSCFTRFFILLECHIFSFTTLLLATLWTTNIFSTWNVSLFKLKKLTVCKFLIVHSVIRDKSIAQEYLLTRFSNQRLHPWRTKLEVGWFRRVVVPPVHQSLSSGLTFVCLIKMKYSFSGRRRSHR
jgi:hypothetical protein